MSVSFCSAPCKTTDESKVLAKQRADVHWHSPYCVQPTEATYAVDKAGWIKGPLLLLVSVHGVAGSCGSPRIVA